MKDDNRKNKPIKKKEKMKLKYANLDWKKNWNPALGLWRHYEPDYKSQLANVHCSTDAVSRILVAAQAGCLDQVDVLGVLTVIRDMQVLDGGDKHGMFRLAFEEEFSPGDDHGVFLGGIALLTLWAVYRQDVDDASRELLSEILIDIEQYCLLRAKAGAIFYPNEFLGYAVCAWLAMDFFQLTQGRRDLLELLERSADYLNEHWGWGEHLSGLYGRICIDQLSALLLLAKDLPHELYDKFRTLLVELVELDDFFAGGPIVPAIRNYAFIQIPTGWYYRDHIRPLPPDATFDPDYSVGLRLATCSTQLKTANGKTWLPIGHTFHELGWHKLVGEKQTALSQRSKTIRCVEGTSAIAYIDNDLRLGSLSRFPLMPSAEWTTWGLAWQSFPVALWQQDKMWAYPQWEVFEAGKKRSHPAIEKYDTPRSLTTLVQPPIAEQTYSQQQEGELLALRVMPAIVSAWDELIDRFRIVGVNTKIVSESSKGNWSQLVMDCGSRQIAIQCLRLSNGLEPKQVKVNDEILDWSVCYDKDDLTDRRAAVNLWGVSLFGPVVKAPVVLPDPQATPMPHGEDALALLVQWEWPNCLWNLKINLMDVDPLQMNKM